MSNNKRFNVRKKAGYIEGYISIIVNTVLFVLKYLYGIWFGSIAVVADAFHTLSDSLTSIVLVLGYRVASKPPDQEHPFGHGRLEFVSSIVIGVLLAVVGYEVAKSSIERLISKEVFLYGDVLVIVLIVSGSVKLILALWAYSMGKRVGSKPVIADAWHHASDAMITSMLAGVLYIGRDIWWIDGVFGIVISIVLIYVAIRIINQSTSEIIGKSPTPIEIESLKEIVQRTYKVIGGIHHIHFHKYGEHVEVTLHIRLPGKISLREAHEIATRIENEIREKLGYEATIHIEPYEGTDNHID
ncbi:MAG: cation diffusion facilitator family transporter [Desulfurococcaceae archaeon]